MRSVGAREQHAASRHSRGRWFLCHRSFDLRFLDKKGVVVGLIEKGMAKKDSKGFVQEGVNS